MGPLGREIAEFGGSDCFDALLFHFDVGIDIGAWADH